MIIPSVSNFHNTNLQLDQSLATITRIPAFSLHNEYPNQAYSGLIMLFSPIRRPDFLKPKSSPIKANQIKPVAHSFSVKPDST